MSIAKITPDDFETFTLETNPRREFSSSSLGVTGAVDLFARHSTIQKELLPLSLFQESAFKDQNIEEFRKDVLRVTGSTNISSSVTTYMSAVHDQQASVRLQQQLSIVRFEPPFSFNSNTLRKSVVINTLMPYYRTSYPRAHFNYANYHSWNFFSASNVPTSSVLLYPNPIRANATSLTDYGFTGSFSFDFWVKPRYPGDGKDSTAFYRPGCLMHLTSAYALSLHSGSAKDINGRPSAFRLLLQLSQSTDTVPDQATAGSFSFFSEDNCLPLNEWSHVTVRWGGTNYNFGTGSFEVDGVNRGYFVLTGVLNVGDQAQGDPSVLCVGNYYQGQNTLTNALTNFFTGDTATREGLYELQAGTGFAPASYQFNYPLKAEIHELKLYDRYLSETEIEALDTHGPKTLDSNLRFYLPPFFTEESPTRTFLDGTGGIPVTPFFTKDGTTIHPFSVDMAFGCGGHYINLENYVRDFATGRFARLWELTSSMINQTSQTSLSANSILYGTGSVVKRLYSILPNDNGRFYPNFDLLRPLSGSTFKTDIGSYEPGVISLRNMITGTYSSDTMVQGTGSIVSSIIGGNSPDNLGDTPGDGLAIYHRTRDNTSNQVVFFDISNMFYGNQIKPGTFLMTDSSLSSSNLGMTIRDDGLGSLYRADVTGSQATWASVGNIFYNEGLVLLKAPQLYFFGKNQFDIEFQGVQNIHVLTVNAFARPMQLITSSNPSYVTGALDELANVDDPRYVFISTVHLHDDNLNVISRTNVAQPILKRSGDKFLFKIKMDF